MKIKKMLAFVTAATLLTGSISFAAIPENSVVLGSKGYAVDLLFDGDYTSEIQTAANQSGGALYYNLGNGWKGIFTGQTVGDFNSWPLVTYTNSSGETEEYAAKNGELVEQQPLEASISDTLVTRGAEHYSYTYIQIDFNKKLDPSVFDYNTMVTEQEDGPDITGLPYHLFLNGELTDCNIIDFEWDGENTSSPSLFLKLNKSEYMKDGDELSFSLHSNKIKDIAGNYLPSQDLSFTIDNVKTPVGDSMVTADEIYDGSIKNDDVGNGGNGHLQIYFPGGTDLRPNIAMDKDLVMTRPNGEKLNANVHIDGAAMAEYGIYNILNVNIDIPFQLGDSFTFSGFVGTNLSGLTLIDPIGPLPTPDALTYTTGNEILSNANDEKYVLVTFDRALANANYSDVIDTWSAGQKLKVNGDLGVADITDIQWDSGKPKELKVFVSDAADIPSSSEISFKFKSNAIYATDGGAIPANKLTVTKSVTNAYYESAPEELSYTVGNEILANAGSENYITVTFDRPLANADYSNVVDEWAAGQKLKVGEALDIANVDKVEWSAGDPNVLKIFITNVTAIPNPSELGFKFKENAILATDGGTVASDSLTVTKSVTNPFFIE